MNTRALGVVWVFLFFLLQNAIGLALPGSHWPLAMIVVVYYALGEGPIFGMILGMFAGFLLDLLGVGKMGILTAQIGLVGLLSGFLSAHLFRESPLTQILLPPLMAFLAALMDQAIMRFYFHENQNLFNFDWISVIIIAPIIFTLLRRMPHGQRW